MKMASSFCYHSFLTLFVLFFCVYMPIGTMCFTMELISRMDIDPILFPKNISEEEKHNRILQLSKIHALNHLESNTNNITITSKTFQPLVNNYGSNIFVVKMMIGSPKPYQPYLLLDTASDDSWVQCDGCKQPNCFKIQYGNFKYHESQTFKEVSCDDPLCVPKKCSPTGNKCIYEISYLGGASTKGIILSENFTFPNPNNKNHPYQSFKGVVFGCSLETKQFPFDSNTNNVAGIFGIARGDRSFLSQLSAETKRRFSYCLSSLEFQRTSPQSLSFLHFGDDAKINGHSMTTRLLSVTRRGNIAVKLKKYYVICLGISFNDRRLNIPINDFQLREGQGGFMFDTGSYATLLMKSAYDELEKNVIAYFEQKGLHPYKAPRKIPYDLCYLNVPNNFVIPKMAYYFHGGARFEVDPKALFVSLQIDEGNVLCLSVFPTKSEKAANIMGARHQQNHIILFDDEKKQVSFSPFPLHTCTL